jgi:hypothetical protein
MDVYPLWEVPMPDMGCRIDFDLIRRIDDYISSTRGKSGSLASEYTAGRYSSGGLGPVAADVLHASPWYGFGAGGCMRPTIRGRIWSPL